MITLIWPFITCSFACFLVVPIEGDVHSPQNALTRPSHPSRLECPGRKRLRVALPRLFPLLSSPQFPILKSAVEERAFVSKADFTSRWYMCQFSAYADNTRDAVQGEDLVISQAPHGGSHWLTEPGKPDCAVCIPDSAVLAVQIPNQAS